MGIDKTQAQGQSEDSPRSEPVAGSDVSLNEDTVDQPQVTPELKPVVIKDAPDLDQGSVNPSQFERIGSNVSKRVEDFYVDVSFNAIFGTNQIGEKLGNKSGQGSVFKVTQKKEPFQTYVVKIPHPRLMKNEDLARRFALESRLAGAAKGEKIASFLFYVDLNKVQGIRELTGYHQDEQIIGAVYQHVEGPTLQGFLEDINGNLKERRKDLIEVFKGVISAVDYLHSNGVIHRDLKPDNIIVELDNSKAIKAAWVIDLGIAKVKSGITTSSQDQSTVNVTEGKDIKGTKSKPNDSDKAHAETYVSVDNLIEQTQVVSQQLVPETDIKGELGENASTIAGTPMGTPGYISPEQAKGLINIDKRTDIFSLGCILYKVLTNKLPFKQSSYSELLKYETPEFPLADEPILSSIVMKMIRENPEDRYQNLLEVIDDINKWEKREEVKAYLESDDVNFINKVVYKTKNWIKSKPRLTGAVVSILSLGIVLGIIGYSKREKAISNLNTARANAGDFVREGDLNSAISEYSTANVIAKENGLLGRLDYFENIQTALEKIRSIKNFNSRLNVSNVTLTDKSALIPISIIEVEKELYSLLTGRNAQNNFDYRNLYSLDFNKYLDEIVNTPGVTEELAFEARKKLHETLYILLAKRFMGNEYIPLSDGDAEIAYEAFINRDTLMRQSSVSSIISMKQILESNPGVGQGTTSSELAEQLDSTSPLSEIDALLAACAAINSGIEQPDVRRASNFLNEAQRRNSQISSLPNFLVASAAIERITQRGIISEDAIVNLVMACKDHDRPFILAELINYISQHPSKYGLLNRPIIRDRIDTGLRYERDNLDTSLHLAIANFYMSTHNYEAAKGFVDKIEEIRSNRKKQLGAIEEDILYLRTKNRLLVKINMERFGEMPLDVLSEYRLNVERVVAVAEINEGRNMPRVYNRISGELIYILGQTFNEDNLERRQELRESCYQPAIDYMTKAISAHENGLHDVHPQDRTLTANLDFLLTKVKEENPEFYEVLSRYNQLPRLY